MNASLGIGQALFRESAVLAHFLRDLSISQIMQRPLESILHVSLDGYLAHIHAQVGHRLRYLWLYACQDTSCSQEGH